MEAKRYGDSELGRHVAGLGTWSDSGVKVYCRRADAEAQRYEALELWKCAAGVLPLRGMELWGSGALGAR